MRRRQFFYPFVGVLVVSAIAIRLSPPFWARLFPDLEAQAWQKKLKELLSEDEISFAQKKLDNPLFLTTAEYELAVTSEILSSRYIIFEGWLISRLEAAILYLKLKSAYP